MTTEKIKIEKANLEPVHKEVKFSSGASFFLGVLSAIAVISLIVLFITIGMLLTH